MSEPCPACGRDLCGHGYLELFDCRDVLYRQIDANTAALAEHLRRLKLGESTVLSLPYPRPVLPPKDAA